MTTCANSPHRRASGLSELAVTPVTRETDILASLHSSPVGALLSAHNLGHQLPVAESPQLLIVSCMDHRLLLETPDRFAFQVRTAGATPEPVLANIAFAVAVAGIRAICVVGHTDCAMCRAASEGPAMMQHLIDQEGWSKDEAAKLNASLQDDFSIDDPVAATWQHARRLGRLFPTCQVAPLLFDVEDGSLGQIVGADD